MPGVYGKRSGVGGGGGLQVFSNTAQTKATGWLVSNPTWGRSSKVPLTYGADLFFVFFKFVMSSNGGDF